MIEARLLARQLLEDTLLARFAREQFQLFSERRDEASPTATPARFRRTADGGVRVSQTLTIESGRVLTVEGERISPAVIRCPVF